MRLGQLQSAETGRLKFSQITIGGCLIGFESGAILPLKAVRLPGKLHNDILP